MSVAPLNLNDFDELLSQLCDDRLDEAGFALLEAELAASPSARSRYIDYLAMHAALQWDAAPRQVAPSAAADSYRSEATPQPASDASLTPSLNRPAKRTTPSGMVAALAALSLAIAAAGLGVFSQRDGAGQADPVASRDAAPPVDIAAVSPVLRVASANPPRVRRPVELPPGVTPSADVETSVASVTATAPAPPSSDWTSLINDSLNLAWSEHQIQPSDVADDAAWFRRLHLDLLGRIPTGDDVEAFLSNADVNKRVTAVDHLLDDPTYSRNFAVEWANLLVGRKPDPAVNRPALERFLRVAIQQNRSWADVVEDLVAAEGRSDENGAANYLVAHVGNRAIPATATTARLFLGVQLHCAQCHNHPFNDTAQNAFWEFHSFFENAAVVRRTSSESSGPIAELVSQPAEGPVYFETRAGLMKVAYPRYEGYDVAAGPEIDRRRALARLLRQGDPPQLAVAFVNRVWKRFFGAGLSNPVDDLGTHSPPAHPELLRELARGFAASDFDVRRLVRSICQTRAYQLASTPSASNAGDDPQLTDVPLFSRMYVKPMTIEQLYDSLLISTRAERVGQIDWTAADRQRSQWLSQFVVDLETDEYEEAAPFEGTFAQALMVMNGELIQRGLSGESGSVIHRIVRESRNESDAIRRLFLAALSRTPTDAELARLKPLLARSRSTGARAPTEPLQDLYWAMLNSNEFALVR